MCGIMVGLDWAGNSCREQVERGLAVLHHRGPDGDRIWRSPGGHVTLGHARLKVLDWAGGDQPHSNETGDIHSIVNGEFYGYQSARADLEARSHRFRTRSDSEILVHLYEEFGPGCIERLRGEFALVLWDERRHMLLAARDRFGIKPLYFAEVAGTLLFASEVKALWAAGLTPRWDRQGFFEKLVLELPLDGHTLFQAVSEVAPAHFLLATPAGFTQTSYWDFNYPPESTLSECPSEEDLRTQLHGLVDEAVRVRMAADVPIACYLSGGLDSTSILACMSRLSARPVAAFCLAFDDPAFDESAHARASADLLAAHLTLVPVTEAVLADSFEATVQHCESIFTNAQCVAKFCLSRALREAGFRVAMTGEGADELFAGYPFFLLDCQTNTPGGNSTFEDRLGYWPTWHRAQDSFLAPLRDCLPSDFDAEQIRGRYLDGLDLPNQLTHRSCLNQSLYLFNRTVLPGYVLPALGDRVEMAHSVEGRLPFLDHRVAEFSRSLPSRMKIRGGAEKFILRKAMRTLVPPEVCGRRKFAMQSPPFLRTGGPLSTLLQDTLRGSALDSLAFLNREAVHRLLDHALASDPDGSVALEKPLLALLTACLLARVFKIAA